MKVVFVDCVKRSCLIHLLLFYQILPAKIVKISGKFKRSPKKETIPFAFCSLFREFARQKNMVLSHFARLKHCHFGERFGKKETAATVSGNRCYLIDN